MGSDECCAFFFFSKLSYSFPPSSLCVDKDVVLDPQDVSSCGIVRTYPVTDFKIPSSVDAFSNLAERLSFFLFSFPFFRKVPKW